MLSQHYTQALLGIKDAVVKKIENRTDEPIIDILIEMERDIHERPKCKELTKSIHDYRTHMVKGPPLGNRFILFLNRNIPRFVLLLLICGNHIVIWHRHILKMR